LLHPARRRRRIMADAVRTVLGFGFDPLGFALDTIGWTALAGNTASERVAVKAGFTNIINGISTSAARPDKYGNRVAVAVRQAMMTRAQFAEIWCDCGVCVCILASRFSLLPPRKKALDVNKALEIPLYSH